MKAIFRGRNLFLLVALLVTAFTFNSCRKDLMVQGPDNLKNALSIGEAKNYFTSKFPRSKKGVSIESTFSGPLTLQALFADKQPIWDKAYEKTLSSGGAVKIPLDLGEGYVVVNEKTKAIIPAASLNYLLMYKDNRDSIHTEWVRLMPDTSWLYGKRNSYKGKIVIYDWNGKQIKSLSYGGDVYARQKAGNSNRSVQNSSGTVEV